MIVGRSPATMCIREYFGIKTVFSLMARGLPYLPVPRDRSSLNAKVSGALRFLFSLAFVFSSTVVSLHVHLSDDHLHIGGTEHEVECSLCELGVSSNNDLAVSSLETDVIEIVAFVVSNVSNSFYAVSANLPFSPRAPPAS